MKKIILHIGVHKTGTTSLQRTLSARKRELLDYGICYPGYELIDQARHYCHHDLARALGATSDAKFDESSARDFFRNLRKCPGNICLLSSEIFYRLHIHDEPMRVAFIEKVRSAAALSELPVKLVMTLREQASFADSLYREHIKQTKYVERLPQFLDRFAPWFDFEHQINLWTAAFPDLQVLLYHEFQHETMVVDFLGKVTGEPVPIAASTISNPSLDYDWTLVKRALNESSIGRGHNKDVADIIQSLQNQLAGTSRNKPRTHFISAEQARELFARHDAGNARIATRYLPEVGRNPFTPLCPIPPEQPLLNIRFLRRALNRVLSCVDQKPEEVDPVESPKKKHASPGIAIRQAIATRNPCATWEDVGTRLIPDCKPVPAQRFTLATNSRMLTVGSCFARNIEEYLDLIGVSLPSLDFEAPQIESPNRPNGILNKYTPVSMAQEIERAAKLQRPGHVIEMADLDDLTYNLSDGSVVDMELNWTPVTRARFLERRRQVHKVFASAFNADCVTFTLGLIEAWRDKHTGNFISGFPKHREMLRDTTRFEFVPLNYQTCLTESRRCIETILSRNKTCKIIVTVSPVPLQRTFTDQDIIIANTHGKSVLRSVAEELTRAFPSVAYFPSFEAVVLSPVAETFEKDLRHVRDAKVGRIVRDLVLNNFAEPSAEARLLFDAAIDLTASSEPTDQISKAVHELCDYNTYSNSVLTLLTRLAWRMRNKLAGNKAASALADRTNVELRHLKALNYTLPKLGALTAAQKIGATALRLDPSNERAKNLIQSN